jgi:hypothetical protein
MGRSTRFGALEESGGLFEDDLLAPGDFLLALLKVIVGDALEIIDVVQENILHEVHLWFNVARDGDVDEQKWAIAAKLHQRFEFDPIQNVMRR